MAAPIAMRPMSNQTAASLNPVSGSPKSSSDSTSVFITALAFLLFNTIYATIRMRNDLLAVTFTISFFVFLMIFFWCLSMFKKLPQESKKKETLKFPIWVLATTLNLMFAYRVWTIIQPGMALGWLVWGMGVCTSLTTFYFFFLYHDKTTGPGECNSGAVCAEQV